MGGEAVALSKMNREALTMQLRDDLVTVSIQLSRKTSVRFGLGNLSNAISNTTAFSACV